MSFGYSVGDVIATSTLCWTVYRACREATGNYKDVTAELESLHINLKNLEDEINNPKSLLNRRGEIMRDEFNHILENVQKSLKELEQMVVKYRSLGTMERRTWDRMRFGLKDLNTIRQKLTYHTAQIKLFLGHLMVDSLGRIESLLEDFVQEIRNGRRPPTLLSIEQGGDEAELGWKQLEGDLSESGISSEDIERHRDDIEEYLAQLTMDLDLKSHSSTVEFATGGSLLGSPIEQISEDNWDSVSQRMSRNENTSAQRKRKDPHTEDLGGQFSVLEKNPANFVEENKRLKLELQKVATENEILRATSAPSYPLPSDTSDFYTEMLSGHGNKEPSHRIVLGESGDRWLAAGSTWDYITKHPLYTKGLVDLGNVTERLKKVAKTDGQGVVWEEKEIIDAIEKSVASGNDEFI